MDIEKLLTLLDIEVGEDFQYFENFADLVENEEDIENDVILELITMIDMKTFAELCESYFYEVAENIPGEHVDVYTLTENIKRVLIGLSEAVTAEEENAALKLADELNKFRQWYSVTQNVECKNMTTEELTLLPVRDALVNVRMERIEATTYQYDFSEALKYKLEEFIMTYGDLVSD